MKVHSTKTDNASVGEKVSLRKRATGHLQELRVLDLFAGENVLWSKFDCARYYGVEKEKGKGRNLTADNLRIIESLDLSDFNVIDADSYGIPFNQIAALYENETLKDGTVIIYTCITNKMSKLSRRAVGHYNLSKIYKKCKTMIQGKARELYYAYLYENGVREVWLYNKKSNFIKDYGYFIVDKKADI